MGLTRRQRLAMANAIVALGCWSIPATAQQPPGAPTGARIVDEDALRRARAAVAAAQLKPTFSLTVNQNDLYVNEVVTVTVNPIERVKASSPLLFTVDFGDGEKTPLPAQFAQVQHRYRAAGMYKISASVGVRPETRATFDGLPTVGNSVDVAVRKTTFSATPAVAAVGEPIAFATPARPGDSRIRYRFTFADDTDPKWIPDAQTTHAYEKPGAYTATMEVGIFDDGENFSWDKSEPISLQVAEVTLDAPASLTSNETGTFTVQFPGSDGALRYRVNFADNSASDWSAERIFTHTYAASGTYQPFAEIGRVTDAGVTRTAASALRSLTVAAAIPVVIPEPVSGGSGGGDVIGGDGGGGGSTWGWLPYVAVVLAAGLLGYGAKQAFFVPRPTFTPHRGQTDSQIESPDGGISLELEVRLHREVDTVQTTLNVPGGRLIGDSEIV
jgi:PKD repeat protein